MTPNTQALKDIIQNIGRGSESFSQVTLGVGQEFVSIVKVGRQESNSKSMAKRSVRQELPAEARIQNKSSEV